MTTTTDPATSPAWDAAPAPPPHHGRGPVVTGVVLVVVGVLWLLHLLGVDLRWGLVLPIAVTLTGIAVLVGGRSPLVRGLVPVGILLAVVAVVTGVTDVASTASSGAGDRDLRITEVADLEPLYELGAGELTLDLRDLDLPPGVTQLRVRVGLGQLVVRVPPDVRVVVDGDVGGGELVVLGTRVDGLGSSRQVVEEGAPDAGTLELEARVGLGRLEVTR